MATDGWLKGGPMDCIINRAMFLRANGTLPCWCDAGITINLQSFDKNIDYAKDVFLGSAYRRIREHLREGRLPFPDRCAKCSLLEPNKPFDASFARDRIVDVIQVEPSMACQLECPSCWPKKDRKIVLPKTDAGHLILNEAVLEKVLTDLHLGGVTVRNFILVGHGDPLANRQVWEMIAFIRRLFPSSCISLTTHACYDFNPEMTEAGLSELVCSIDGVDQESYVKYRIGGNFDRAYRFMSDFAATAKAAGRPVQVTWQYIVFEHNDSDAQLLRAQELALQAGISRIFFVITWLGPASKRIFEKEDVPILPGGGVRVDISSNKVGVSDLEQRIETLREDLRWGSRERVDESLDYLTSMFKRLFPGGAKVPARHFEALRSLVDISEVLEPLERERVLLAHDDIVKRNIVEEQEGPAIEAHAGLAKRASLSEVAAKFAVLRQKIADGDQNHGAALAVDLMGMLKHLFGDHRAVPAEYYSVLRDIADVTAGLSYEKAAQVLIAHDSLVRESDIQSNAEVELLFDEAFYLRTYPDVAAAVQRGQFRDGFEHFARWGSGERRMPSPDFGLPSAAPTPRGPLLGQMEYRPI
jgi:4Fe-4S single cluster domain